MPFINQLRYETPTPGQHEPFSAISQFVDAARLAGATDNSMLMAVPLPQDKEMLDCLQVDLSGNQTPQLRYLLDHEDLGSIHSLLVELSASDGDVRGSMADIRQALNLTTSLITGRPLPY